MPLGIIPGPGGAPAQLARRFLGLVELAAVPAQPVALARNLARADQDLAALVLDSSLRLVLLGVLQPSQAALQDLAFVAPGVALGLGLPLGLDRAAVGRDGRDDLLGVPGSRVGPGLHPVQLEFRMGSQ